VTVTHADGRRETLSAATFRERSRTPAADRNRDWLSPEQYAMVVEAEARRADRPDFISNPAGARRDAARR
jgi:hypothetical protein